jgi:type IV secretion system protein VirB4
MDEGLMPFADIDQTSERRWAVSWVADICRSQGLTVSPEERGHIQDTLEVLAQRPRRQRDFSNFAQLMMGKNPDIAQALEPYAGQGDLGSLLNADQDYFRDDDFIVIELGGLTDLSTEIYTPVLTYLFHKVSTLLSPDRPTHVVADEFFAFAQESPQGREYVEQALRTYRKKNAFLTIGTQDPSDLIGEETQGILNSIQTMIMLPNPGAQSEAQAKAYRQVGLNDEQIGLIARSTPKQDYIAVQPSGSRKFDLGLDVELAFLTEYQGLDLKETAKLIREYKSRHGSSWIYEWLCARGYEDVASEAPLDKKRGDGTGPIKYLPKPTAPVAPGADPAPPESASGVPSSPDGSPSESAPEPAAA